MKSKCCLNDKLYIFKKYGAFELVYSCNLNLHSNVAK